MTKDDSEIIDFYPEEFHVDMNGKKMLWQGVALLPFIDEKRLLGAMAKRYPELTDDENRRNAFGKDVIFVNEDHSLYDQLSSLYMKRKIDNPVPLDPQASKGFSGTVLPDESCVPNSTFINPLPSLPLSDLKNDKSISAYWWMPEQITPHTSSLLPGYRPVKRVLTADDIETIKRGGNGEGGRDRHRRGPAGDGFHAQRRDLENGPRRDARDVANARGGGGYQGRNGWDNGPRGGNYSNNNYSGGGRNDYGGYGGNQGGRGDDRNNYGRQSGGRDAYGGYQNGGYDARSQEYDRSAPPQSSRPPQSSYGGYGSYGAPPPPQNYGAPPPAASSYGGYGGTGYSAPSPPVASSYPSSGSYGSYGNSGAALPYSPPPPPPHSYGSYGSSYGSYQPPPPSPYGARPPGQGYNPPPPQGHQGYAPSYGGGYSAAAGAPPPQPYQAPLSNRNGPSIPHLQQQQQQQNQHYRYR